MPTATGPIWRPETTPRVSVVMAVYNPHPRYFPTAVQSVLNQTVTDLELIVVEDPSGASAGELLREHFSDPRIRHILNPDRTSLEDQRNRCLAEARSEYVAVLDADDVMEPDRLQRQLSFIECHPSVDAVGCQLRIVDHGGRELGFRTFPLEHTDICSALPRYCPLAHGAVLYRRATVIAAGGYRPNSYHTAEDYDLWSRLVMRGRRLGNLAAPLVRYRIHPCQTKATRLRDTIRGVLEVKRRYWRGRMSARDRVQMRAEALLLYLPISWVLPLLIRRRWLSWDEQLLSDSGGEACGELGFAPAAGNRLVGHLTRVEP